MNYRHIYHAGNFADVFKHVLLILLTKSFLRKDTAFCYLDTHAGIGQYDLFSEAAQKSKEYVNGIKRIIDATEKPDIISEYLDTVFAFQKKGTTQNTITLYPGSPFIVKPYLRPHDRMMLCELHPDDYKTLKKNIGHYQHIAVHHQDAYQGLKALLPPKEKRGFILIDPPYENKNEFLHIITSLSQALSRFETGVYAIWYPIKDRASIDKFHQSLKEKISRPLLTCDLTIYPDNLTTHLNGCGMAIINPPFQLDEQLETVMPWLWKALSINNQGQYILKKP